MKQLRARLKDLVCRIDARSHCAGLEQRTLDLIDQFGASAQLQKPSAMSPVCGPFLGGDWPARERACGLMRGRRAMRRGNHPSRDGRIGLLINQDEGACRASLTIAIESDRAEQVEPSNSNAIDLERFCRLVGQGADFRTMMDVCNESRNGLAGVLQQISPAAIKRTMIPPHQRSANAPGDRCRCLCGYQQIAAADIELTVQDQAYGRGGRRLV